MVDKPLIKKKTSIISTEIICAYSKCPNRSTPIPTVFLCQVCRERTYCSTDCLNKDWNEIHSEMCLSFSRGTSELKFRIEDFELYYLEKPKDYNNVPSYGVMGTSKLVKHVHSLKPFVLKTVKFVI